ncbi:hypothetical protein ACFL5R_01185 [Pseudomonadota bacterium]
MPEQLETESLTTSFKSLYCEFVAYLNKTGLSNRIFSLMEGKPIIDFQFTIQSMGEFSEALDILCSLPSYPLVVKFVAEKQNVDEKEVEKSKYGLFSYIFSDLASYLTPPSVSYSFSKGNELNNIEFNEERLSHAILNAVNPGSYVEKKDKLLVVFENLKFNNNVEINDEIKLIKLSPDILKERFIGRYESDRKWSRVYGAFEIDKSLLENDNVIPVLSTLLRIYKSGDVRYKAIYQEANHFIRGDVFVNYKNSFSENDYYENTPSEQSEAWRQYDITKEELNDFSRFLAMNIKPMLAMSHSCRMYNMVFSSPLHLRVPLLFFVMESFFSDVDSEVVFRIALYVTNILNEDESFMSLLKKLYGVRSKIAHGDIEGARKQITKLYTSGTISLSGFKGITEVVDGILNRLWKELLCRNWNPSNSSKMITEVLLSSNNTNT